VDTERGARTANEEHVECGAESAEHAQQMKSVWSAGRVYGVRGECVERREDVSGECRERGASCSPIALVWTGSSGGTDHRQQPAASHKYC
jgi:hypothetical protein